jgi:hypothetical protein
MRSELFLKFPMELEPNSLFQCWRQTRQSRNASNQVFEHVALLVGSAKHAL